MSARLSGPSRLRVLLVCLGLPLAVVFGGRAHADVSGDVGLGYPSTSSVMAANPSLGVDRATGGARASYPFDLPQARGGAQPSLGLSYDSGSSTREAGVGWGLSLPSIERHNPSGPPLYQDPAPGQPLDPQREDRFEFNGQPLVPICKIPSDQCPKGERMPPFTSTRGGWHYFRFQNEGPFTRFFWSGNTWVAQMKSGELWVFGSPLGEQDTAGLDYTTDPKSGTLQVFRWNLILQMDAPTASNLGTSNAVVYRWAKLGIHGLGYLTDIFDTPNSPTPSAAQYAHHTSLSWELASGIVKNTERIASASNPGSYPFPTCSTTARGSLAK